MKTKRIAATALSAVMAMSLTVPAFAGATKPNTETEITGTYKEAIIDVLVPQTGTAFINPYGLGTSVTKSTGAEVQIKGQIVTAPMYIVNNSGLDLDVGAVITPALGENATMKLATASTNGTPDKDETDADYVAPATAKSAYVIAQGVASAVASTGDELADADIDKILDEYALDATWAAAESSAPLTVSSTGVAKPVEVTKFATLKKATLDTTGTITKHEAGSVMLYRLTGDCVKSPKDAWAESDTFTVNMAFTFSPAEETTAP